MRISVDAEDPGYTPLAVAAVEEVLIDGHVINGCITADEEKGYVLCYLKDQDGNYVIDETGEHVEKVELTGEVQVVLKPGYTCLNIFRIH